MWRVGITVWPSKPLTYLLLNSHLSTDRLAMSLNTKAMVAKHFVKVEGEDSKWACACGKVLVQKVNTGYTNLVSHVRTTHPDWLQQQLATQPQITNHTTTRTTTKNANNMYAWLEWVCVGLKPFSFVEDELTRKYTKLTLITVPTLKNTWTR